MSDLQVVNPHFLVYDHSLLHIDVLGGVNTEEVHQLLVTLRVSYGDFPIYRTTLDLYRDSQREKLIRSLCDRFELPLLEVAHAIDDCILALEQYRLEALKSSGVQHTPVIPFSETEQKAALRLLQSKTLVKQLTDRLHTLGIIGEDQTALVLFLAMASHDYTHPFSVLCLAKPGMGKSYLLQKLADCMPKDRVSFHTQISANALYYFTGDQLQRKALFVEDLEWTTQMLNPLATLQTHGRLVKTRATKDKDGKMQSSTFEVVGKLCLIACAHADKNYEALALPFLMLHLNHSALQDQAIMDYQKQLKAGLVPLADVHKVRRELQCLIASLQPMAVINPYATLIELPKDIAHPRKSLLLLLNFIEVVTYFFQRQRKKQVDEQTGEEYILTHPDDIALAFSLLKTALFRKADELSTAARGFYNWLTDFLAAGKLSRFTALDIRKARGACTERSRSIHPRTLNRYLQELKLYNYLKIIGGNKYRGGFIYALTGLGDQHAVEQRISEQLQSIIDAINQQASKSTTSVQLPKPVKTTPNH